MIGKLVYFINPIFKINKIIEEEEDFIKKLEEISNLEFSDLVVEDLDPSKILARNNEMLKFNYIGFKEKVDAVEKFQLGIGENGYYFDLFLNFEDRENNLNKNTILKIISNFEAEISKVFNSSLADFYIKSNLDNKIEVTNFILFVEFNHSLDSIFNSKFMNLMKILSRNSETIIKNVENEISIDISLNINPRLDNTVIIGLDPNKIIIPQRGITLRREIRVHGKYLYQIRFRGVPVETCFEFLEILD